MRQSRPGPASKEHKLPLRSAPAAASKLPQAQALRSYCMKFTSKLTGSSRVACSGPDLGPLASIMVAPEEGAWRCDEVTVSSSRSRHTDRFVCKCAHAA